MLGGVVSTTVTLDVHVADELPDVSVALHETVVLPNGKVEPEGGVHVVLLIPQLSVAIGVNVPVAPVGPVHSS